ncbi:NAD-dependent protein deacetylase [Cocleimonas flava]|uniref:protein acetyllysine N-acetyltransferase n=1 Tax=Cocleimonas flava TaxID=634765 RepID=A0A4R1F2Z5_9GAMM|nr:NAD-dependent protein deacetylase [Cocleimonas flava]TCJ84751.1 NAD-dependent SIR2 family protein deacetylase [Cocleimonas flava]
MPQESTNTQYSNTDQLITALKNKRNIWVLSGAGISAPSGIPTYRDNKGNWQAGNPIQHNEFITQESFRKRYWARSMAGWIITGHAKPNAAHQAITQLQESGRVSKIVTQNVDRLHSNAGAKEVIDLHGRIDQIICLDCNDISRRADYQPRLEESNPALNSYIERISSKALPDGDANIDDYATDTVNIPPCEKCAGTLMPDVVFFGGIVPKERVELAFKTLAEADCLLVIGSSLKVFSGFRFPRWAHQNNLPLYAINQGEMRGEEMFDLVVPESCEEILPELVNQLI